jgi:hypothetical protein
MGARGGKDIGAPGCYLDDKLLLDVEQVAAISFPWGTSEDECTSRAAQDLARREENMTASMLSVEPLAGTWVDGIGEDRVELVLDAKGAGSIRLGDPSQFPEVGDPTQAFLVPSDVTGRTMLVKGGSMVPGFRYALIPKAGRASEMSFVLNAFAPWDEWCSLQPPIRGENCYSCMHDLGGGTVYVGDECGDRRGCYVTHAQFHLEVDCGRVELCSSSVSVCSCTKDECVGGFEPSLRYTAMLDPVDTSVLRLLAETGGEETRYLTRVE